MHCRIIQRRNSYLCKVFKWKIYIEKVKSSTKSHIQLYTVNTPLLTLMKAEDNLPRRRSFGSLRFLLLVSAEVRGAGTRDEPPRTSAWEATLKIACFIVLIFNTLL